MERNKHERNKKYGWLIVFALINWVAVALVVLGVDPGTMENFILPGFYLPMGILLGGGLFWLLAILTLSAIRALRLTLGIMTFLYLRLFGLGSILNGVLIAGLLIIWEIYTMKAKIEKEASEYDRL